MADDRTNLLLDASWRCASACAYAMLTGAVLGWLTWPVFIVIASVSDNLRGDSTLHSVAMFLLAIVPCLVGLGAFLFDMPRPLSRRAVCILIPITFLAHGSAWLAYWLPLAIMAGLASGPG